MDMSNTNQETKMETYSTLKIRIKDGADDTSEFKNWLRFALIQLAGGASFKDMDEMTREALSWIYTAE
jgi:hypothetical protein